MAQTLVNTSGVVKARENFSVAPRLLFLLAFAPPLILGVLVWKYGVDVMDWDQWKVAALFAKKANGVLTFGDLFAQQGEYRQFFPNLIFLGLGSLTHWDIRYEMLVIFLLACVVAVNLYHVAKRTLTYSDSTRFFVGFLASLLIFSPAQFENWLDGEQIMYLLPAACFATSLRIIYSNLSDRATLVFCALLSVIATFSAPNGIVCWIVLAPAIFLTRKPVNRPDWRIVAWIAAFLLSLGLYAYGYHKPPYSPPLNAGLQHPLRAIFYFFSFLGVPVITNDRFGLLAAILGASMAAMFATSFLYVWKLRHEAAGERLIAWIAVGAYSVATGLMVTLGRVGYGPKQAISSRYGGFSVYLAVSLCWLAPELLSAVKMRPQSRFASLFGRRRLIMGVVACLMLVHFANAADATHQMAMTRMRRLQTKACLLFVNVVPDGCAGMAIPGDHAQELMNTLNRLHYLRPGLIRDNRISKVAASTVSGEDPAGHFEGITSLPDGDLIAKGTARLAGRGDPADAVLLTYQKGSSDPVIFAVAQVRIGKASLRRLLSGRPLQEATWDKLIPKGRILVQPPVTISTWALDGLTGNVYKIAGSYLLPAVAESAAGR